MSIIQDEPAAVALRRIINDAPNKIDLIVLSPLTDIALSIRLYDDFFDNIRSLHIMGGNYNGRYILKWYE